MLTHEEAHVIPVTDVRLRTLDETDDLGQSRELRLGHGGFEALLLCAFLVGDPSLEAVPGDGQALRRHGCGFGGFADADAAAAAFFGSGFDERGQIGVEAG